VQIDGWLLLMNECEKRRFRCLLYGWKRAGNENFGYSQVRTKPTEYAKSRHCREAKNALPLCNAYGGGGTESGRNDER